MLLLLCDSKKKLKCQKNEEMVTIETMKYELRKKKNRRPNIIIIKLTRNNNSNKLIILYGGSKKKKKIACHICSNNEMEMI